MKRRYRQYDNLEEVARTNITVGLTMKEHDGFLIAAKKAGVTKSKYLLDAGLMRMAKENGERY